MSFENIKYSLRNIWQRKARSFLTILSIFVGITTIFIFVSFGWGLYDYVNQFATGGAADKLTVQVRGQGAPGLDDTFKLEESDTAFTYGQFDLIKVPLSRAIDGVDYRENTSEYEYKRLPDCIDAGLTGGFPAYKGKSIARKVFKIVDGQIILTDNNNSSLDFKVLDNPTPGQIE